MEMEHLTIKITIPIMMVRQMVGILQYMIKEVIKILILISYQITLISIEMEINFLIGGNVIMEVINLIVTQMMMEH